MHFTDRMVMDGALRRTADGYAVVSARVARGGNVQTYLGSEVGVPDKDIVRVFRPEAEVFKRDAIKSYAGVPVTIGHPRDQVTAGNWKDLAVGEVGEDVLRDGEFVRVPMMLRDAKGIKTVEDGAVELSMGYSADLKIEDGLSPKGEPYDAVMTDFRMNHVAIVEKARGGSELRIGDADHWGASPVPEPPTKELIMADAIQTKTVIVDGLSVITTDQGEQAIVKLQKQIADAAAASAKVLADHAEALKAKDAELAKKDAEIDDLKKKVVDAAALDKLVAARANLVTVAKAIAKDVKVEGLTDTDIKKAVVVAALGDAAVKDKSADYINARFDILAEDVSKKSGNPDPFAAAVRDGITPVVGADKAVDDAYAQMVKDMQSAHLGKAN